MVPVSFAVSLISAMAVVLAMFRATEAPIPRLPPPLDRRCLRQW